MSTTTALSHYTEANVLKSLFFNTDFPTALANVYIALFTVMPAEDGTGGTEVSTSGTAYGRQAVSGGTHNTGAGAGWSSISTDSTSSTITNANDILYAVATGSGYGTVVGIGIYDASTSGNLIAYGVLASSIAIGAGDQFKISAGNLSINLA